MDTPTDVVHAAPVRVIARVRQARADETPDCDFSVQGGREISCHRGTSGGSESFRFDYVYSREATTSDVYERSLHSVVAAVTSGINASILAVGCSGGGKTATLQGINPDEDDGLIGLLLSGIYKSLQQKVCMHSLGSHCD